MNFKSLLLGSAAAIVLAGGAQAADLTVAEPVDYVKVCDAFGAGFFYSPGTDTCIKVGGYVEFGTNFGGGDFGGLNSSNNNWGNFYTEVSIQLTASSVTEYGNLTGFIDMRAKTGNDNAQGDSLADYVNQSTNSAYVDSAYLELGPLKAGYFTSLFDFGRGYDDTGMFGSDSTVDHIQLTYAVNGFGLSLSIEDQRDRGSIGYYEDIAGNEYGNNNIPDIVAAVTYSSGIFAAKIAGVYTNSAADYDFYNNALGDGQAGWAIGGGLEVALDSFSAGDRFFVSASYGDNANSFTGISGGTSVAGALGLFDDQFAAGTGTSWSALASYKHVWTPQLWSSLSAGYANFDGSDYLNDMSIDAWRVGFNTAYAPVKGLELVADVFYTDVDAKGVPSRVDNTNVRSDFSGDSWTANLFLKRSW
jgi:hypothetical protein